MKLQLWKDYFPDVLGRHVMCLFYCLCILLHFIICWYKKIFINVGPFIILFNFRKCFVFSVWFVLILILLTTSLLTASSFSVHMASKSWSEQKRHFSASPPSQCLSQVLFRCFSNYKHTKVLCESSVIYKCLLIWNHIGTENFTTILAIL